MKILVTGSAGHLGEALMRSLAGSSHQALGIDRLASSFTHRVGSITDRAFVRDTMHGIDAVLHTATLHKPHVATHTRQDFLDVNCAGTLNLLEEAAAAKVQAFVFTSTTSAFGRALTPPEGAPAAWVTEAVQPVPKNIYGTTKIAAENLCELVQRDTGLPVIVLRTSRFFPEDDDEPAQASAFSEANLKLNEFLYRRVDIEDVVDAHLLALERAPALRFGRYIISATTPFTRDDLHALRTDAPSVLRRVAPGHEAVYGPRGWTMFPGIDRVYVNTLARDELGWKPRWDFHSVLARVRDSQDHRSEMARLVGRKGYHAT
jgi:UDP-glucose 4-epimerase